MSQFSETTTRNSYPLVDALTLLGYPQGEVSNNYYTAQVRPGVGVCVAVMLNTTFIQFFPWGDDLEEAVGGRQRYSKFINAKAKGVRENYDKVLIVGDLGYSFTNKLSFMQCDAGADVLTIKCIIEEGIKECELSNKSS